MTLDTQEEKDAIINTASQYLPLASEVKHDKYSIIIKDEEVGVVLNKIDAPSNQPMEKDYLSVDFRKKYTNGKADGWEFVEIIF